MRELITMDGNEKEKNCWDENVGPVLNILIAWCTVKYVNGKCVSVTGSFNKF